MEGLFDQRRLRKRVLDGIWVNGVVGIPIIHNSRGYLSIPLSESVQFPGRVRVSQPFTVSSLTLGPDRPFSGKRKGLLLNIEPL